MSETSEKFPDADADVGVPARRQGRVSGLPARLAIELVIGLSLAAVLMLVAWASSSAIRFVYGGY
jgi:hypothetical protein